MLIFAKNKLDQTIFDKISRGTNGIELHLDQDFMDSDCYWDEEIISSVPIYVVHSPLIQDRDCCIERIDDYSAIERTCKFANQIAYAQSHDILVVVHLGMSVEQMRSVGAYDDVKFKMLHLVESYDRVHIAVENISKLSSNKEGVRIISEVSFVDAPQLVAELNHPKIGTCIDICHVLMDIRLMKLIRKYTGDKDVPVYEDRGMKGVFEANANVAKLIHFANCTNMGLNKDHGTPMTLNETELVQEILDLYTQYNYKCPITLEVREDDYRFGENYSITKNTLEQCLNVD